MSGWSHHDGLPVSVTQGSGNGFKPEISPAGVCSLVPPHRQEGFREERPQWRRRAEEGLAPPGRHLATSDLVVRRHGCSVGDIAVSGSVRLADQAGPSLPAVPHVAARGGRATRTPGLVPVDRLPDAEQGKADRAGSLAA
ncbi:MAG: hypothetical protein ACRYGC_06205 [Janthinobacterium lividum]